MPTIIEVRTAIDDCERKITEQVKRGTSRDKILIRKLQVEHDKLTNSLASILEENREQPIDKKDETHEKYRDEQEQKSIAKKAEFERIQAETVLAQKKLEELTVSSTDEQKKLAGLMASYDEQVKRLEEKTATLNKNLAQVETLAKKQAADAKKNPK